MALDLVMMPMSKENEAFCVLVSLTRAAMQMKKPGKLYKTASIWMEVPNMAMKEK